MNNSQSCSKEYTRCKLTFRYVSCCKADYSNTCHYINMVSIMLYTVSGDNILYHVTSCIRNYRNMLHSVRYIPLYYHNFHYVKYHIILHNSNNML